MSTVTAGSRAPSRLRFHPVTVAAVEPASADGSAVVVTCRVPGETREELAFTPGQHVTARATIGGAEVRRSYSLCSTPEELERHGVLRVGIRTVPGGVFSSYANGTLSAGDPLDLLPPVGSFGTAFDPARRRRYGAIVGGSGITPVLSLMTAGLATEPHSTFTVLYGNRDADSMMFAEELADLKNRHPDRLQLVHAFSREEPRLGLAGGRLDPATLSDLFTRILEPAAVQEWFLCGPAGLVRDARRTLSEHGVDGVGGSAVHVELFHPDDGRAPGTRPAAGPPRDAQARELKILLGGRVTTVRTRDDRPILDAALEARPELPYSCRSGVCATCRARVVAGEVSMSRNWALTEDELAAGYVLTCQSVPVTGQVTVDFDVL
ncbi:2Fe-2S iron-sulfur cluster-binding protein [Planotetraspora sp. A-T 1434]|uniref:2Fe-2S iron-sulfur cluster-binding protein n=1 Tax=Planotetraspora sp. A-T 1434 TaxID=2979219 RepID=UPI0021C1DAAF|nr:2Fe-2S iron-sulfur cluster-binding protein [Planotetraspora sp. A-T 1434]MCT9933204.1 2Fe-2S iron-sulfur cluster-binding protein [Planotetraspora sp. A-T 1434]